MDMENFIIYRYHTMTCGQALYVNILLRDKNLILSSCQIFIHIHAHQAMPHTYKLSHT